MREKELAVLRRTERAMVRTMCGVKLMDKKNILKIVDMLGVNQTLDKLSKANGMR